MHVVKKKPAADPSPEVRPRRTHAPLPSGAPQFLTVAEVAALLRLSPKTIYKMVSRRRIPFRKPGGHLLFEVSEIDAWTKAGADNR